MTLDYQTLTVVIDIDIMFLAMGIKSIPLIGGDFN